MIGRDPRHEYDLHKIHQRGLLDNPSGYGPLPPQGPIGPFLVFMLVLLLMIILCETIFGALPRLPGTNEIDQLHAAGTLIRIIDSILFSWGARIFAGLLILNAGISLKNQAFGLAFISIIGAIVIGTAPMWVKNIFDIGGGTLFSAIFMGRLYV